MKEIYTDIISWVYKYYLTKMIYNIFFPKQFITIQANAVKNIAVKKNLFKVYFLLMLLFVTAAKINAQSLTSTTMVVTYVNNTASMVTQTSPTTIINTGQDDVASSLTNIGFDFYFDGVRYTQFSACSNGVMRLGGTLVPTTATNALQNANGPLLAPFYEDLTTGSTGYVKSSVEGTAPNRSLVVEWYVNNYTQTGTTSNAATMKFQVVLFETTNIIHFTYGTATGVSASYSLGVSNSTTDYVNVNNATPPTITWGASVNNSQTTTIVAGRRLIFTPSAQSAAVTGFSCTTNSSTQITLNWTDVSNELGYVVYYSTNSSVPLDGSSSTYTTAIQNATSLVISGLSASTLYYFKIFARREALSPVATSNCTTNAPCTPPVTQATIGSYTNNTTGTSLTTNWTRGDGTAGVIVVARLTATTNVNPTNGTTYTANTTFGSGTGSQITGAGNYVVYVGTGTTVNVTGLAPNTGYTFTVYEYNTTSTCYKIAGSSSAVTTSYLPGDNCSNAQDLTTLSNPYSSTTASYTNDIATCNTGSPDRVFYIDVVDGATLEIWEPSNGYDEYEYIGYGASCPGATQIKCWDNDVLAHTTWTNTTGSTQKVWYVQDGLSGASGTFSVQWTLTAPCTPPVTQATIGSYTNNTTGTSLTTNWARGDGTAGVIVVARLTATTNVNPQNGTTYTANTTFGSGTGSQITGAGNYVVYVGTGTTVNVTGLAPNTGYTFTVYEYNTTNTCYKIAGSSSTVSTPAPANNDCANAIAITPGLSCVSTNGTTVGATQDGPAAPGACSSTTVNDVWYTFTADGSSDYTINVTNTAGDMVVQLFSNTCASPVNVTCADVPSIGTETISAGVLTAGTYRYRVYPYNGATAAFTTCVTYTVPFNPCTSISNLTCGTSVSPTIASGTGAYNLTNCYYAGTPGKEVIYTFTPTTSGTHYINQTSSFDYIDYMFKASSGGCGGSGWTCIEDLDGAATSAGFSLTAGTQYYILLDPEVTTGGSVSFSITCPAAAPSNDECAGAITLTPGAAGAACSSPTAGNTDAGTESVYGCLNGYPDDDVWYKFVATASSHTVTVDGAANFDAVIGVYTDCLASDSPVGGDCSFGDNTYSDGIETLTLTGLTVGTTYYVNVYDWWDNDVYYGYTKGGDFTICVTTPPAPSNDNCAGAISLTPTEAGVACSPTAGSSNGGSDSNVGCDDGNEDDDVWYSFTAVATSHIVNVDGSSSFRAVVGVYTTCAATVTATGGTCYTAAANGDAVALTLTALSVGTTYYVKVHNYNTGGGTFTICVTTPDNVCPSGPPLNDEPCNAVEIALGSIASGNNACATISNEPSATPGCWSTGNRNTVWYSFIAPAGGNVKVRTAPGSLRNTQIAVYTGTCGSGLILLGPGCNDDAPDCGATDLTISELSFTSLTTGARYYISVDGNGNSVGSFAITVINSASAYPASSGQECSVPISVCNTRIQVGNPGYQGIGFTCDANSTIVNCTTGERGSVWYKIDIAVSGTLLFDLVPNDYDPLYVGDETDYDFVLWKVAGTGATTCALINSTGGENEVACNYDYLGVTGLSADGYAPSEFPGYNYAYETGVAVTAGESYLLVVQNYSNSLSGFDLDFKNTGPGVINTSTPPSVTWTGGSNSTIWDNMTNWGGCTTPTCSINGVVSPSSAFQPTVTSSMGTINVKNLTIDPGATLTLGPNAVIKICENLTNNGTIVAHPTSSILFNDNTTTHQINGTLIGSSSIGNLTITDLAGGNNCTVIANTDIEINGNFTTTDANSIFDLNGNNLLLNGNFSNAAGSTTFANTTGSTIYFNGTGSQTYSPNTVAATPTLTLNNVVMNNSGAGVTISTTNTPNMILGTSGTLTLTAGKIVTPGNQEVTVTNTANTAVSAGNTSSYIQGNLRRYLAAGATGSFDFPVGNAAVGYERANINFTSAAAATPFNLLAKFNSWGGAFPMPGAPGWGPECYVNYNLPYLDNGYWTIDASASTTGTYTASLYNLGYTNTSGASGWSIAKSPSSAPDWALNGLCAPTPSPTPVIRTAMTGFSDFGTIQSSSPLPVELALFTIMCENTNGILSWATASELNTKEFIIERSASGNNFEVIGTVTAAGNSNSYRSYNFTDFNILQGQAYYRLKMVDFDDTYKYSSTLELDCEKQQNDFSVYYSEEQGIVIKSQIYKADNYSFEMFDMIGKRILAENIKLEKGSALSFIKINNTLADGVYLIRVNNSEGRNILTDKLWLH